jgi:Xaa-Pro aminopeptidase
MLYATRFFAPDPFLFVEARGRRLVVMSDLERDRARRQAAVHTVLSWTDLTRRLQAAGRQPTVAEVAARVLADLRLRSVVVPRGFPLGVAEDLRRLRVGVRAIPDPFWPEREVKQPWEVRAIEGSLRAAEAGLMAGVEALRACRVGGDGYLRKDGRRFTAEDLRAAINTRIMAGGGVPSHTICAAGDQAVDPHEEGHGAIRAHAPVVMDIFPRSERTGYYGDLTRTVVRGRAAPRLRELHAAVREGVAMGHAALKAGADGRAIHESILEHFARKGFRTGLIGGRMQGFFHGTGHGLGLQIHEPPSIGKRGSRLRAGHVVTVEPGLYYLGLGGVRIEDVALVTAGGSRNLTRAPDILEI